MLLPALVVIVGMCTRWQEKLSQIQVLGLVGTCLWPPYTIVVHSYAGVLTQLFLMSGIIFQFFLTIEEVVP